MDLSDDDIGAIALLLSPERLAALHALTSSTSKAIEFHQETLRVGSLLMNVIATVEISLRNAVCENLTQHFNVADWLTNPPAPFQWRNSEREKIVRAKDSAQRSMYAKLTQAEKSALDVPAFPNGRPAGLSHSGRAKRRRATIPVTEGKIVAELTLYFWKKLYGPEYEQSLWKPTLKRTFPYKKLKRATVANNLEVIYQTRNRLAHHEPVLHGRFNDTVSAIEFVLCHLVSVPPKGDTPLAKLIFDDIAEAKARADALHAKLSAYRSDGGN